jgi:hypothetical protein
LDWLDVDLTTGISYDAIQGGAGGYISQGWRYAGGNEIDALATRYIGSPEQTFVGGVDFLQTLIMIEMLGPTFQRDVSPEAQASLATLGYYSDGASDPNIGLGEFTVTLLVPDPAFGMPFTGRWTTFDDFLAPDTAASQIGSFLVRTVPEPPMLLLMLLGIATYAGTCARGQGLWRRSRRCQVERDRP